MNELRISVSIEIGVMLELVTSAIGRASYSLPRAIRKRLEPPDNAVIFDASERSVAGRQASGFAVENGVERRHHLVRFAYAERRRNEHLHADGERMARTARVGSDRDQHVVI